MPLFSSFHSVCFVKSTGFCCESALGAKSRQYGVTQSISTLGQKEECDVGYTNEGENVNSD